VLLDDGEANISEYEETDKCFINGKGKITISKEKGIHS
jgi:hypothetical protein